MRVRNWRRVAGDEEEGSMAQLLKRLRIEPSAILHNWPRCVFGALILAGKRPMGGSRIE
jgi:hypothetical protein